MELREIIRLIDESPAYLYIKKTLRIVGHALKLYEHKNLFISFNGGKDAEVVLHLVRLALYKEHCKQESEAENLEILHKQWKEFNIICFEEGETMPEVEKFTKEHAEQYRFEVKAFGKDVKKETHILVDDFGMKAIFLGTRRVDPHSANVEFYSPSDMDKGWAAFMRIHPLIDWTYEQVWIFLRDFKFPYCSLYDLGYTHLGNHTNSEPNKYLEKCGEKCLPAYKADSKYEHYSRKCFEVTKEYLDTKHFVFVYKVTMTDLLDTLKTSVAMFGDTSAISIIELKNLKAFMHGLLGSPESLKPGDVTIVYSKWKVSLEELGKELPNINEFKILETKE